MAIHLKHQNRLHILRAVNLFILTVDKNFKVVIKKQAVAGEVEFISCHSADNPSGSSGYRVTLPPTPKKVRMYVSPLCTHRKQLRWPGHVIRMGDHRVPKQFLFCELSQGHRKGPPLEEVQRWSKKTV
ncbi:hypothetical protein ElyMa_004429200 [Elysia marginata]|uniref:Uncharacterized protein n=1 Tax=Elysia marginata TaxID=1093978 RepID=A0AAV4HB84_9GAST|nr:hypothetical protein ElyMa_004429200 [Elysia marginata]